MQILCLVTPWWHLSQRRHPGGQAKPLKAGGHVLPDAMPAATFPADVTSFFMTLPSFRGFDTPSLQAQGGQRRSPYFNKLRDIISPSLRAKKPIQSRVRTQNLRVRVNPRVLPLPQERP